MIKDLNTELELLLKLYAISEKMGLSMHDLVSGDEGVNFSKYLQLSTQDKAVINSLVGA